MNEVEAARTLGVIRFCREGDRLLVSEAPPVAWFARHALDVASNTPDVGLSFDGTHVTLHAHNGVWVWRLTGFSRWRRVTPAALPFLEVEGRWPD